MVRGLVHHDLGALNRQTAQAAGERQYLKYGQGGIRAEAGDPTVVNVGLPFLR